MAMAGEELRRDFLEFFRQKGHAIVPSAPLLPASPNLLFTNSGMNAFVPYFLGQRTSPHARIADAQKCIRAGGKHNDLEDVGFDAYHHTFFEMLGNWSFGDFFKEETIHWAWELLVHRWGLPKERLHATVYAPDAGDPAERDGESLEIWRNLFLREGLDPEEHLSPWGAKENFWAMGETGPCGPCTEIHVDLSADGRSGRGLVNRGNIRCMELWNLVFIQYNALGDGNYERLERNFVDTGMGLERLAGICAVTEQFSQFGQSVSNYASDLFAPLIRAIGELGDGKVAYGGTVPADRRSPSPREALDCAFRVVADHCRALTLAIGDGILPGNEGRNYVLRRILRRAVLFARRLGLRDDYLAALAKVCIELLSPTYPELERSAEVVRTVLNREQEAFEWTIDRGLQLLESAIARHGDRIPGSVLFELYDTYGFPVDLAQLIAAERGRTVDLEGFQRAMEGQRARGRALQKTQRIQLAEEIPGEFVGRSPVPVLETTLLRILPREEGGCYLAFAATPFYGEMGGQVGDRGTVTVGGREIAIANAIGHGGGTVLHAVEEEVEERWIGSPAQLRVDWDRRRRISIHHSATHILQAALRKVLGSHVTQAGSLVTESGLRFDFSHHLALDEAQLEEVEALANRTVRENYTLNCYETAYERKPAHCLAHFSESYGSLVRVVEIGATAELCGGTHVAATGEIGAIKILSESGIAAGVRRIEAVAGEAAQELFARLYRQTRSMARSLHCTWEELPGTLAELQSERRRWEKERDRSIQIQSQKQGEELLSRAESLPNGLKKVIAAVAVEEAGLLRRMASQLLARLGDGLVLLLAEKAGAFALAAGPGAIAAGWPAGPLVERWLVAVGGRGGGKESFASGSLGDGTPPDRALRCFSDLLR
ncbi:MAG: alanine--tRNA ligase [Puniceicoccales bacterium]|jgi:alanyl-tRNA synthetase|nr:alanine--tRNA ligase [Puniceicoccales bacterium]